MYAQHTKVFFDGVGVVTVNVMQLYRYSPGATNAASTIRVEEDFSRKQIVWFNSHLPPTAAAYPKTMGSTY
jgi:hypothetical protein